jgi:hypothetical protein
MGRISAVDLPPFSAGRCGIDTVCVYRLDVESKWIDTISVRVESQGFGEVGVVDCRGRRQPLASRGRRSTALS